MEQGVGVWGSNRGGQALQDLWEGGSVQARALHMHQVAAALVVGGQAGSQQPRQVPPAAAVRAAQEQAPARRQPHALPCGPARTSAVFSHTISCDSASSGSSQMPTPGVDLNPKTLRL